MLCLLIRTSPRELQDLSRGAVVSSKKPTVVRIWNKVISFSLFIFCLPIVDRYVQIGQTVVKASNSTVYSNTIYSI